MKCPKCGGPMFPDVDNEGACLFCGNRIYPELTEVFLEELICERNHRYPQNTTKKRKGQDNLNYGARLPIAGIRVRN